MFYTLITLALCLQACSAISIVTAPSNATVTVGTNTTIACVITGQSGNAEGVSWKKKTGGAATALTFNTNVLAGASKYSVAGTFNLTIHNVQVSDDGTYQCVLGTANGAPTYEAIIKVVVLPRNFTLSWQTPPGLGVTTNLTCKALYGRPPPTLKWYKGNNNVDVTNQASVTSSTNSTTGYGDVTSALQMTLANGDHNKPIRCQADYAGLTRAKEASVTINLRAGTRGLEASFLAFIVAGLTLYLQSL